jgi:hypothetical protein
MIFTEEQLTEAETFGALCYPPNEICIILKIKLDDFLKVWVDENSDFMQRYAHGAIIAKYSIDVMIFNNAQNGDFKALQEYKNIVTQNQKKHRKRSDV